MTCNFATPEEWDAFLFQDQKSSFFHQRAWLELFETSFPSVKAAGYIFKDSSGQSIFVPGLLKKMFKQSLTRFDSGPVGTYGDFLSQAPLLSDQFVKITEILKKKHSFHLYLSPETRFQHPSLKSMSNQTQVINFNASTEPDLLYNNNTKRNIAKSKSLKHTIRLAASEKDWSDYYKLYLSNAPRWGRTIESLYPYSLFHNIQNDERLQKKLYLIFSENDLLYGALVFFFRNKCYYWHGSGSSYGLNTGASSALQHYIIYDLWSSGRELYDLMPNGGHDSVFQFKSGLGATSQPLQEYIYHTSQYRLAENLQKFIRPALWS